MLLKDMQAGQKGKLLRLLSKGLHCRRLCEMGFLPGTEFIVRHKAPLGYPIAVAVRGYEIIIGSKDASTIEVEIENESM